jgi:hypothetical protein
MFALDVFSAVPKSRLGLSPDVVLAPSTTDFGATQELSPAKRADLDTVLTGSDLQCFGGVQNCGPDGQPLVGFADLPGGLVTFSYTIAPLRAGVSSAFQKLSTRQRPSWVLFDVANNSRVLVTPDPNAVGLLAAPDGVWALYDPVQTSTGPVVASAGGDNSWVAIVAGLIALGGLALLASEK